MVVAKDKDFIDLHLLKQAKKVYNSDIVQNPKDYWEDTVYKQYDKLISYIAKFFLINGVESPLRKVYILFYLLVNETKIDTTTIKIIQARIRDTMDILYAFRESKSIALRQILKERGLV